MADRGIRIPILADVSEWLRGTKRISDDLDDLGQEFKDTAKNAEGMFDDIPREADRAFKKAADNAEDAFRRADFKQVGDDIKEEVGDTAREVGASFSSWEDALDGVQEVIANIGGKLGGLAGVALGVAGAAGLGSIVTALNAAKEAQENLFSRAEALYEIYQETGSLLNQQAKDKAQAQALEEIGDGNILLGKKRILEESQKTGATYQQILDYITGWGPELTTAEDAVTRNRSGAQGLSGEWAQVSKWAATYGGDVATAAGVIRGTMLSAVQDLNREYRTLAANSSAALAASGALREQQQALRESASNLPRP